MSIGRFGPQVMSVYTDIIRPLRAGSVETSCPIGDYRTAAARAGRNRTLRCQSPAAATTAAPTTITMA
jgi:hypothetical protein